MSVERERARELGRILLELGPRLAHAQRHLLVNLDPPLSYSQYRTLYQVARGRTSLTALRAKALVGLSTLSEGVDTLVRRGLLDRTPSERDRRAVELDLTDAGRTLLATAESLLDDLAVSLVGELSEVDGERLTAWLEWVNRSTYERLVEHHEQTAQQRAEG